MKTKIVIGIFAVGILATVIALNWSMMVGVSRVDVDGQWATTVGRAALLAMEAGDIPEDFYVGDDIAYKEIVIPIESSKAITKENSGGADNNYLHEMLVGYMQEGEMGMTPRGTREAYKKVYDFDYNPENFVVRIYPSGNVSSGVKSGDATQQLWPAAERGKNTPLEEPK